MSTQFTAPSTRSAARAPAAPSRRAGTIGLELQSAYKFALAIVLGIASVWVAMPFGAAAVLVVVSVVLAARALAVLAADPASARSLRPREHATWDGILAGVLAIVAVALVIDGSPFGAGLAGAGAITLAALRLRTRYVAG